MPFETRSDLTPEGGHDDVEAPETSMLMSEPRGVGRDAQTDARSISEASGQMSDELDMSGWQVDADSDNIDNEIRQGGWMKYTLPVGGMPARGSTSGSRGAADIGRI